MRTGTPGRARRGCSNRHTSRQHSPRAARAMVARRVMQSLREQGIRIGRYRVRAVMREASLRTSWKRKFVSTTDSRHTLPVAENVLASQFDVAERSRAWVSDTSLSHLSPGSPPAHQIQDFCRAQTLRIVHGRLFISRI
ncbi:IS3 family transposase [Paraburkholderia youngii]|uniref:IS3 family transposase n=1 Tax=Paraburkholderia youngii TaxID=2782701 RepID=UPI003D254ACC